MNDRSRLYASAFLRALATGLVGVTLGLHLDARHLGVAAIGAVVSAGLAGAAVASVIATFRGDAIGRRRFLVVLALLMAAGGAVVALANGFWTIAIAAFIGMVNGMGRDRGAGLVIEQAVLPATVPDQRRTRAFALYNVFQDAGHAFGALLASAPSLLARAGIAEARGLTATMLLYAVLALAPLPFVWGLSAAVEARAGGPGAAPRVRLSPETRRILTRISALFGIDSLAGGFLTTALLAYFFHHRFGAGPGAIGALFFGARVANALSHLAAAWLAPRIGLVNTMVFTHIPSSLLLVTVAFAPNFPVAAALFLLREGLVEMDVPTRQSYVMAVVRPEERTVASGITHLVRLGAWAVAPAFAGLFMSGTALLAPLVVGGAMKIAYDLLLYRAFRHLRPPEERTAATAGQEARGGRLR